MKILITADLHYREQWFRLLSRVPEWDLVCIAGDLLDMLNAEPRIMRPILGTDSDGKTRELIQIGGLRVTDRQGSVSGARH